uniref:Kinetochore-associated protein 1 n=1 Tax=Pyxicephalus adspersus TaxID=30357 RepID=A0AAV3ACJ2_PYXAD|nr:TPA: hypothetical protein GDO54_014103 [Pyxicephalus adspersus]
MWNDIEILANDDTGSCRLNIDSRQESGTALYQVDTLLKISSTEKVTVNPKLFAFNSNEGCIIVVDKSVCLLDSICQSLQLQLQFDTEVDVVGICHEGQFLVVGERNGNVHLIHVLSRQILITKAWILKLVVIFCTTFYVLILIYPNVLLGVYHMFLLTNGGLYCIMYFHLARINDAVENMDFSSAKELEGKLKTCFTSTEKYHTEGCLNLVIGDLTSDTHLIVGGRGDYALSKWKMDPVKKHIAVQILADSNMIQGLKKLQILDNLLFVLDEHDILSVWDVYTLVLVWDWPSCRMSDFLLTTEGDSSSSVTRQADTSLKLIVLTVPNDKQMRNLAVYSLPTMNHLYSIEVSDVSSLVQIGITMDTIYLLEGIYDNNERSSECLVNVLALRCLTEALPENRLSRLLHKLKFEEAEKFAIQFGLDVELVYKVKVNTVLEKMASASIGSYGQSLWHELVDEAKDSLVKIKDDNFVAEYCVNAPWPTYETAFDMLSYAKTRIQKKEDKALPITSDDIPISITDVLRAQARLATFYGAFGPDKFSGIAWIEFLNNSNVLKDIFYQLEEMNLSCAQYLWLRHQAELESKFDEKILEKLLGIIPANIPSQELCLWFKNILIPFVRRIVPKGHRIIAKWLEHRARSLELTDKANWPENGYEMAEVYFTSKNPAELGIAASWLWIHLKEDRDCEEVQQLMKLVTSLQELVELYRKYNCRLALSEFEKETTTTIVFRMLDKVLAPELIPSTLEKFIRPYMHQHNLNEEELLLQYIKDMLERCSSRSASLFETAWEAKAMAVIGCMTDTDLIFDAVLQIMYGAVVPWSDAVEQLVKQHLEMDHPKVKLLQESYRLMEMNNLLRGYGIRAFNFLHDKNILNLIKYILKQDSPSSLEDSLKIADAYQLPTVEVYIFRLVQLIYMNRGDECLNLLKSISPSEAEKTVERLSLWARIALQESPGTSEECKEDQKRIARILVDILKFHVCIIKDNLLKKEIFETNLKMFEAISSLQWIKKGQKIYPVKDIAAGFPDYYDALHNLHPDKQSYKGDGERLGKVQQYLLQLVLPKLSREDSETLESSITEAEYYLKCCIYLSEFEFLNIPYTLESFHSSPKEGMIKGLWKNHSHEARAMYTRAIIVVGKFVASCPPSPSQLAECYQSFLVLLKCPVLADLDLLGVARQYAQIDLPAFTLGCLLLIPHVEKREQQIQGFLSSCNPETVLLQVADYMNTGEVAGIASQIKGLILDSVIRKNQLEKIVKTKCYTVLKTEAIRFNRVKDLADYLLDRNCLDDAAELVIEFLNRRGKPYSRDASYLEIVKSFLNDQAS